MKRLADVVLVFCVLAFVSGSWAAVPEWTFDPNHCEIVFKIKHVFAHVTGVFEEFEGKVLFDPDDLNASAINVKIAVNSINTRIEKRDQHLRSEEFFETENFPYMIFTSSEILHKNDNHFMARGRLTIKDVTKEITLPFTFVGSRENPFNKKQELAGFEAEYTLDRLTYNVGTGKYYRQGLIDKDVTISIHLELVRDK